MTVLFDKHARPILRGMTDDEAWEAVKEFEDYVYINALSFSENEWDCLRDEVPALFTEYYALFG